jgi:hypothetical protein
MLDTTMHTNTHTINVSKTCALQQTTAKTGIKHRLCEIDVNITNGVIFFTHHEIVFGLPRFQSNIIILPVLFDISA